MHRAKQNCRRVPAPAAVESVEAMAAIMGPGDFQGWLAPFFAIQCLLSVIQAIRGESIHVRIQHFPLKSNVHTRVLANFKNEISLLNHGS